MNKALLTLAAAMLASTAFAQESTPAFPGAEGHGRYVTGGRGGKILHVTRLDDDSNEGSFRWAVNQSGARIIVFDVSGTIYLKSDLTIKNDNVSILGQTAPGEGITIAYRTVTTSANNIIVRFMRFRRSQVANVNDGADAFWGRQRSNIMIDHCSFSWSIDEVCSLYDNKNFTLQWSTVCEGLNAGHEKGDHSYGGIWGGKNASFHHNMIAHVNNRAPRFNGARYNWTGYDKTLYANSMQAERVDFRNIVLYNWGNGNGSYGGPGGGYINIVNSYYKAGPGTKNKTRVTQVSVGNSGNSTSGDFVGYASRYFIEGNYVTAADEPENYDWKGVIYDGGLSVIGGQRYIPDAKHLYGEDQTYVKNGSGVDCIALQLDEQIDPGMVTTHSARTAYEKVLSYGGASRYRDAADARYVAEARTGTVTYTGEHSPTPGIVDYINDPQSAEVNEARPSFPVIKEETRPTSWDSDRDGIPDEWEVANGLNPNDASDGATYTIDPRGWYTNFEVYANSLVEHIMKGGNADAESAIEEYYPECVMAGITDVTSGSSEIVKIEYFTLDGIRVEEPVDGVNIRRITFDDGHVEADKVLKK